MAVDLIVLVVLPCFVVYFRELLWLKSIDMEAYSLAAHTEHLSINYEWEYSILSWLRRVPEMFLKWLRNFPSETTQFLLFTNEVLCGIMARVVGSPKQTSDCVMFKTLLMF